MLPVLMIMVVMMMFMFMFMFMLMLVVIVVMFFVIMVIVIIVVVMVMACVFYFLNPRSGSSDLVEVKKTCIEDLLKGHIAVVRFNNLRVRLDGANNRLNVR